MWDKILVLGDLVSKGDTVFKKKIRFTLDAMSSYAILSKF